MGEMGALIAWHERLLRGTSECCEACRAIIEHQLSAAEEHLLNAGPLPRYTLEGELYNEGRHDASVTTPDIKADDMERHMSILLYKIQWVEDGANNNTDGNSTKTQPLVTYTVARLYELHDL
ncbi:putative retrotransposon hot spot protein 4 (RHS4) [Trypanosoma vivax]|nr:putative retrotransposon hot spot protein 4 (RHS4) [Trypanosoma vivax]